MQAPSLPLNPAAAFLLRPFVRFYRMESASGILLMLSAVIALAWANSPWSEAYFHLWELPIGLRVGNLDLTKSLHHWINDGLMGLFFFVVGLELKREMLLGELASPKRAALSITAAAGGMIVPALLYALLNRGGTGAAGWGIPMATDIAFALGVLTLLGKRVPLSLKVFVTAVAIVDDLGAVLVIALFYTAQISWLALGIAAALLLLMVLGNRLGIRSPAPYLVVGIGVWLALLQSGIHATLAGVLAALTIPARSTIDAAEYLHRAQLYLAEFQEDVQHDRKVPTADQRDAVHSLEVASRQLDAPLMRLERMMHPWVAFGVMPVFALANAGVAIGDDLVATMASPITLGVMLGLLLGKPVGILTASWIAVRAGVALLPSGTNWRQLAAVGLLCGIGFTMSLFIASLAFALPEALDRAKLGILAASLIAGVLGAIALYLCSGAETGAEAGSEQSSAPPSEQG